MNKIDINEIDGEVKESKLPLAIIISLGVFGFIYFGLHFINWLIA